MMGSQGLSCGSAPCPCSAPSIPPVSAPRNCSLGRPLSIASKSYFWPLGRHIRGQFVEATRAGGNSRPETAPGLYPALTLLALRNHPLAWREAVHGTSTRRRSHLAGYLEPAAYEGARMNAAAAYLHSARLHLHDASNTKSPLRTPALGCCTTSIAITPAGAGAGRATVVADAAINTDPTVAAAAAAVAAMNSGPVVPRPGGDRCDSASNGSEVISSTSNGHSSGSSTADGPIEWSQACSAGGRSGADGDKALIAIADSFNRRLAPGGRGLRQSNWRLGWWDDYEREVQAAASEVAVLAATTAGITAADAGLRPERANPPLRHRMHAVAGTVPSSGGLRGFGRDWARDGHGSQGDAVDTFIGPAAKRPRLSGNEKEEVGRTGIGGRGRGAPLPSVVAKGKVAGVQERERIATEDTTAAWAGAVNKTVAAATTAEAGESGEEAQQQSEAAVEEGSLVTDPEAGQGDCSVGQSPLQSPLMDSETALYLNSTDQVGIGSRFATTSRDIADISSSTALKLNTATELRETAVEAKPAGSGAVVAKGPLGTEMEVWAGDEVDERRIEGPDVIPPFVDPDQEQGRLEWGRIQALYYIRELVLGQLTASADVRLLADALDWSVPLMDLKSVREAFRMIRTASVSVAFPRNSQLMPRPRFLSSFHFLAQRLLCLLEVYGPGVMDWPYLVCVATGMSAGRVRDRQLMQILHDRGLEMLRQSCEARGRWKAKLAQQQQQQQQQLPQERQANAATAVSTNEAGQGLDGVGAASSEDDLEADHSDTGVRRGAASSALLVGGAGTDDNGRMDDEEEATVSSAMQASGGYRSVAGRALRHRSGRRGRNRVRGSAAGSSHVPAIGLRDLVCSFLLPLHHLGQLIDPEYLHLMEGMLTHTLRPRRLAGSVPSAPVSADTAVSSADSAVGDSFCLGRTALDYDGNEVEATEGSVSEPELQALHPPPKLWLLRDALELYSLMKVEPSPMLLHLVREGCTAAAAELRAAAATAVTVAPATMTARVKPAADDAARAGGPGPSRYNREEGVLGHFGDSDISRRDGSGNTWERQHLGRRGDSGAGHEKHRALKGPRPWARAAAFPRAQPSSSIADGSADGDGNSEVRREYEALAGTLASALYLLSRVVRKSGGGVFFDGSETSSCPSTEFGLCSWDLAWAHDALEALVPWMQALKPLQLSGLLRTTVWLGAADRFLLPHPPPGQALWGLAGGGCGVASSSSTFAAAEIAHWQWLSPLPQQQQPRPTAFLRSYFIALSRAVSEQPISSTVTIGNIVEAAVGVAAAGVAAYGVPREARDLYGKLLFRANAIMAYQSTQRNGFLPPYALNLVTALAAVVRDAGSTADVPAKLVADNLRLGERLLPAWHADGLAQVAAALETMKWVVPPGGWVDSFYAALSQRLHASLHMPEATATATASPGAAATSAPVATSDPWGAAAGYCTSSEAGPQPAKDWHDGSGINQPDRDDRDGLPLTAAAAAGELTPDAATAVASPSAPPVQRQDLRMGAVSATMPFHFSPCPPSKPDPLTPASLMALLRAARHLASVASPAAAAASNSASNAAAPCGVMPESLAECLAARLGQVLAEGEGLYGEDLMELVRLCRKDNLPSAMAAGASTGAGAIKPSKGSGGSGGNVNEAPSSSPSSLLAAQSTATNGVALGGSLALLLLDMLEAQDVISISTESLATDVADADVATAASVITAARTRHIILNALEQALALQLQRKHPALAARSVVALSRSLEQALGRPPEPVWGASVRTYLEGRCDAELAAVRQLREAAAAKATTSAPQLPPSAEFNVIQAATDLLDFCTTTTATVTVAAAAAVSVADACASSSPTFGQTWWQEVSYSASVCVDFLRKRESEICMEFRQSSMHAMPAGTSRSHIVTSVSASSARLRRPSSLSPETQPTESAAATPHHQSEDTAHRPGSESGLWQDPDLEQAVDLLIRYSQHLGRWLAATRAAEPVTSVDMPSELSVDAAVSVLPPSTLSSAAPFLVQGLPQKQFWPQQQKPNQKPQAQQRGGHLQPHISFLIGLFSLLEPMLQEQPIRVYPPTDARKTDAPLEATTTGAVSRQSYKLTVGGEMSPVRPPGPTPLANAAAALPGQAAYARCGYGDNINSSRSRSRSAATLSATQLVRLADILACSRFQPLRFSALVGWHKAYLAKVESLVPLLSSVDSCMVVRALSCQGWRPPAELMDALLDRVTADGGLARVCTAYGPASLVQMMSWLSFARFLPAADWLEAVLDELVPYIDAVVIQGNCSSSSRLRDLQQSSCSDGDRSSISSSNSSSSSTSGICSSSDRNNNGSGVGDQGSKAVIHQGGHLAWANSANLGNPSSSSFDEKVSIYGSGPGSNCKASSSLGSNKSGFSNVAIIWDSSKNNNANTATGSSVGDSSGATIGGDRSTSSSMCSSSSSNCSSKQSPSSISNSSRMEHSFKDGRGCKPSDGGSVTAACYDRTVYPTNSQNYGSASLASLRAHDNDDRATVSALQQAEPGGGLYGFTAQSSLFASSSTSGLRSSYKNLGTSNTSSNANGTLRLGELCVLGNALAELRYHPPKLWLDRVLAAAGSAAVGAASAVAAAGGFLTDRVKEKATDYGAAGTKGEIANRWLRLKGAGGPLHHSAPMDSAARLASQLAALLWRWSAVASTSPGSKVAASARAVGVFAREMAAATGPLLFLMGPSDLVRCAEGMAALQQLMVRQHGSGGGGGTGDLAHDPAPSAVGSEGVSCARLEATMDDIGSREGNGNSDGGEAMTGTVALDSGATQRAGMLERSMSILDENLHAGKLNIIYDNCGVEDQITATGGGDAATTGPDADMPPTASNLDADGSLSLRSWWLELERASANVLLTRPPQPAQPPANLPRRQPPKPEPQLKPYNLSVMLRCMAAASCVPSYSWLQRYCQHTLPLLKSYKAQDIAVTMWAFAHMRISLAMSATFTARVAQSTTASLARGEQHAQADSRMVTHRDWHKGAGQSSNSDVARGSVTSPPEHQMMKRQLGDFAARLHPRSGSSSSSSSSSSCDSSAANLTAHSSSGTGDLHKLQAQKPSIKQLTAQAAAPAVVRVRAPPALGGWMEAAVALIPPLLRHCTSADIQNISWALVALDFPPPAGWLLRYELATEPRLPYLSGAAMLYSLWAYSKFGHAPSDSYMEATLQALRPGLLGGVTPTTQDASLVPPYTRQNPSGSAAAAANSVDDPAAALLASHSLPLVADAATTATQGSRGGVVEPLDAQSLALLLHSLAQLDYLPGESWLAEYLQAVLKALPTMSSTGLAIMFRAVATLQVYPTMQWLDAVMSVAGRRLPHFSEQQLESFLSALVELAPRALPSAAALQRFLWACLAAAPDNRKVGAYYRLLAPYTTAGTHDTDAAAAAMAESVLQREKPGPATPSFAAVDMYGIDPSQRELLAGIQTQRRTSRVSVPTLAREKAWTVPGASVPTGGSHGPHATRLQKGQTAVAPALAPATAAGCVAASGRKRLKADPRLVHRAPPPSPPPSKQQGLQGALRAPSSHSTVPRQEADRCSSAPLRRGGAGRARHAAVRPWRRGAAAAGNTTAGLPEAVGGAAVAVLEAAAGGAEIQGQQPG